VHGVRFIAVGDVMLDVLVEGSGHDASIDVRPGGSAPNAAVWAAALGADSIVVGRIGDDAGGRLITAELEARGVRAELSADAEAPTGTFLRQRGELTADRGANARLTSDLLPSLEADAVLVSGYLPRPTLDAALGRARAPWVALDAARLRDLPAGGNVLLANEETARALGFDPDDAKTLLEARRDAVVVTRGAEGAIGAIAGRIVEAAPPRRIGGEPVGTGDAFAAALLVSLARGHDGERAVADACATAADAAETLWPA
jgi:sugar/nucleoside kinase (ribokinase family)